MHPTDNGQGSRQRLLTKSFRAALTRPFGKTYAAAFAPGSGSLDTPCFSYSPRSTVYYEIEISIPQIKKSVKQNIFNCSIIFIALL